MSIIIELVMLIAQIVWCLSAIGFTIAIATIIFNLIDGVK